MSSNRIAHLKKLLASDRLTVKNVTAITLFGAIVLVFVFFGLPHGSGVNIGSVARVNNALISFADFQQEEDRIRQYYTQLFGGGMDFSNQRGLLRQQALETLVQKELVSQAASRLKIYATDEEVRDFIVKDIPFLQENGVFQRELYFRYLEMTRSTPRDFESKVRKDIQSIRLRQLFESSVVPMSFEQTFMKRLEDIRYSVQYVKWTQEELQKKLGSTEAVDAFIKELEQKLQTQNQKELMDTLVKTGSAWKSVAEVNLSEDSIAELPGLNLKEFFNEVSPQKPLFKRILRQGGDKYIVQLKDLKKVENSAEFESPEVFQEVVQKRRASALFDTWLSDFRDQSKVQIQTDVLK